MLREFLSTQDVARVIQTLKDSGLRGMGGAGFPTGLKWEIVRNATGNEKYVVVNADESEPGTFKDRFLMDKFPYLLIEGIFLGAYVVGAQKRTFLSVTNIRIRNMFSPKHWPKRASRADW